MLMNANPVTGIVYVSDLTLAKGLEFSSTKGNIYFSIIKNYFLSYN